MVTNFAHLKSYPDLYDKALFAEDMLVDGTSKEHYVQAMSSMRGVIDLMAKKLTDAAGLTDKMILSYANAKPDETHVNLFYRIKALSESGTITGQSAEHLHEIRKNGNSAVHAGEEMNRKGRDETFREAEQMYKLLYEETYRFVHQYVSAKQNAKAKSTGTYKKTGAPRAAAQSGGSAVAAVIAVLAGIAAFLIAGIFALGVVTGGMSHEEGMTLFAVAAIASVISMIMKAVSSAGRSAGGGYPASAGSLGRRNDPADMDMQQQMFTDQMKRAQFDEQQRLFMEQMERDQHQFTEQQLAFSDQQNHFMDQMNQDQQFVSNDFGGMGFDSGLDFGGGFGFGNDFGGGFGGGFGGF